MDQGRGRNDLHPGLGSGDAALARASELQHAIEGKGNDLHLGRPALVGARAQPVADHLLPPCDGGLGFGAPVVPCPFLPSHVAVLGDASEMAVALGELGLGRVMWVSPR